MKKTYNSLKSIALLLFLSICTVACDKDFANIDSDIQGVKNFNASSRVFPLLAYTKSVTPFTASGAEDMVGVQTNGMPLNLLGAYKDPNNTLYGTTEASIITQIVPSSFSPDFGSNPSIESVVLRIPYFSTLIETNVDGDNFYEIDSLFGDINQPIKLSIYQSNYLLRSLDPETNFEENQNYYSNQEELFDNQTGPLIFQSTAFTPDPTELEVFDSEGEITERLTPALRLDITEIEDDNTTYWEDIILNSQESGVYNNLNSFTNFFRGLYFKAELADNSDQGSLVALNFLAQGASITVEYSNDDVGPDDENKEFVFNFSGIRTNLIKNTNTQGTDLNGNPSTGDENLYLKGFDGYMSVIELFGDEEDEFKAKKDSWLINEANLIFHVNEDLVAGDEPTRIMLFDLKNNTPIIDYFLDGTTNSSSPNDSKIEYAEALSNGRYKFRLTNHVNNILVRDSTNVKLGLYVSANVNLTQNSQIQNAEVDDDDETQLTQIPTGSILQPKGTILHGNLSSNVDKRPVFEIYYTEPDNN
ncbi:DUF4270 domain-containing protein [Lacinutrix sp. MedPE-SW]|uniref:DUF4270 domain-containing protein n=1 Tax=Lacinutrix sp. MedPE-SW TaxID=1860087 RepID=UPI0009192C9F|nr:DUF4270 domain-containing protein [Lacinutrix sp. MedPE-SW]OIQ23345.1 MAG: hypothetical protein BM549_04845 [Lacinutrix sp. MedPE-SW]